MSTFLVTGGAGFIGSHVCTRLLAQGDRVVAVDDLSTGRISNLAEARTYGAAFTFQNLDIRTEEIRSVATANSVTVRRLGLFRSKAWMTTLVWRKRTEKFANNPRLRRQRQAALIIRDGLVELRRLAAENKSDEFFGTLFHLLQEQLGERLELPASAITEAVIEEQLRPRGAPETTLAPLHEIFQACNLARYAPVRSSQELAALIPRFETVLRLLQELKP